MEIIHGWLGEAKGRYDANGQVRTDILRITSRCIEKLSSIPTRVQRTRAGREYNVYVLGRNSSRPCAAELYINSIESFVEQFSTITSSINGVQNKITASDDMVTRVIYTAIMSFAICYDIWKPGSRKTPGTYFEVLLGSILSDLLPGYVRKKHVLIPNQIENVSTDIVFEPIAAGPKLVIPAKITTRERIVQAYAHQRILDAVFGEGAYKSILMCVSETQRDEAHGVNDICVPGTIRLFQSHLAKLHGIFYIDPPERYLQPDITGIVSVGTISSFLTTKLAQLIRS